MDQQIQLQIDQDNFLTECVTKANEAVAIAEKATAGRWLVLYDGITNDTAPYAYVRKWPCSIYSEEQTTGTYIAEASDESSKTDDFEFIAHARTSNPDLAARVLQLVELVRERDQQITTLSQESAVHRCDKCRLYMSEDQMKCPNCGARQDGE